jgi:hypothetical protein
MRYIFRSVLAASICFVPVSLAGQERSRSVTGTPQSGSATSPASQNPRVEVRLMSMDAAPRRIADPSAQGVATSEPHWSGRFFRCPNEESARRVLAAVERERPKNAEAAEPVFDHAIAVELCRFLPDDFKAAEEAGYADSELTWAGGVEFEEDGQSVQLITTKDSRGRPIALVYAQGAC